MAQNFGKCTSCKKGVEFPEKQDIANKDYYCPFCGGLLRRTNSNVKVVWYKGAPLTFEQMKEKFWL